MRSVLLTLLTTALQAAPPTSPQIEFFESRVRPILAQDCYECHSEHGKQKGGLLLDSRPGWQAGGDSGPAIVPGNAAASLLIQSIRHEHDDLIMPKNGVKLDDRVIADLERWITDGAADPRDTPPAPEQLTADTNWESVRNRRAQWWSFQPLPSQGNYDGSTPLPAVIDHHINQAITDAGLTASSQADPRTLLRRLHLTLTGLLPSLDDTRSFLTSFQQNPDSALAARVDQLLASPTFGERWARHWMDWIRYAETHGSEGDPAIPHAWRYRDYLVRALNADLPYPQLLTEHIAGDLLAHPRRDPATGLNESALATGHYRMVLHGFTPTDPLDELATTTDNQIDVVSKAFLGLTVSCARCHDHKFDPISQADFYALYGIFASCKPALIDVSASPHRDTLHQRLRDQKPLLRKAVATLWTASLASLPTRLSSNRTGSKKKPLPAAHPLSLWQTLHQTADLLTAWTQARTAARQSHTDLTPFATAPAHFRWHAHRDSVDWWFIDASGSASTLAPPGSFAIPNENTPFTLLPSGLYSHLDSEKDRAVVISPRFTASKGGSLWVRIAGNHGAVARFAIQNYPRRGTVYPKTILKDGHFQWVELDLDYFDGESAHIELTTEADQPVETSDTERSWFGITDVVYLKDRTLRPPLPPAHPLFELLPPETPAPADASALATLYQTAANSAITAWLSDTCTNTQAAFLTALVQENLLPSPHADVFAAYRSLEQSLPTPVRAPGILEADPFDQPLFAQGNHKQPLAPIQRRFLEVVDPTPYHPQDSGRLALAQSLTSPATDLPWRVIVNRVWHHLFGTGLVPTPDNFGRLGELPSHPQLLDLLAARFRDNGASLKSLIRDITLTHTFQRSSGLESHPSAIQLASLDPDNRLLSHFPIRRLEAETIRDTILQVSGQLDPTIGGPAVPGTEPRRSLYVSVIRNKLDPFLSTFDAPVPASTRGRRDATNVPAQSLSLLNDPSIIASAQAWAKSLLALPTSTRPDPLIDSMFQHAFVRPPTDAERTGSLAYLEAMRGQHQAAGNHLQDQHRQIDHLNIEIDHLLTPYRQRLQTKHPLPPPPTQTPKPYLEWDFQSGINDLQHHLPLTLHGTASLKNGFLSLDGGPESYASTPPLAKTLHAKTLEAWLQLPTLDQRGGGVITLQDLQGNRFDSIVFAEKAAREWVAGSDRFSRSESLNATPESKANALVHLAVTYAEDGTVTAYRNGLPHGKPYRKAPLATFPKDQTQVLLGLRHGKSGGNRILTAQIARARVYDRALTPAEVADSFSLATASVREADVIAALAPADAQRYQSLTRQRSQLQSITNDPTAVALRTSSPELRAWSDLAQALFNLKEFIYLR